MPSKPVKVSIKPKRDFLLSGSDLKRIQQHLGIATIRVSGFKLEFQTDKRNTAIEKRIEKMIEDELDGLEKEIISSCDMCIAVIKAQPERADAFAAKYDKLISGLLKSSVSNLKKDVVAVLKKAEKDSQLKLESDIAIGLKFIFSGIKVIKSVALIAASHGAHIKEWINLAKTLYDLGKQIYEVLKDEAKRLKEFKEALVALRTAEGSARKQAVKTAAEAYKKYRDKVTQANDLLKDLGRATMELQKKMQQARNLKEGVKAGAQLMVQKRLVTAGLKQQLEKEKLLAVLKRQLAALGGEADDRTWLERVKAFDIDTLKESVSTGKEAWEAAKNVKETVDTIAGLVK